MHEIHSKSAFSITAILDRILLTPQLAECDNFAALDLSVACLYIKSQFFINAIIL